MFTYSSLNCVECNQMIRDPYYLQIDGELWHEKCAQCSICHCLLKDRCYIRHGHLFCRKDYMNRFGIHCRGCGKLIKPNDSVLRSYSCRRILTENSVCSDPERQNVHNFEISSKYPQSGNKSQSQPEPDGVSHQLRSTWIGLQYFHELCFKCCVCGKLLRPGEEYTLKGFLPLCMTDYRDQSMFDMGNSLENKSDSNRCLTNCEEDLIPNQQISDSSNECLNKPDEFDKLDDLVHAGPGTKQMHLSVMIPDTIISAPSSSGSSSKAFEADEDDMCELDSDSESGRNCKRPRTILTASQRRRFKAVFDLNPKPTRKVRESLAMETGLNIRVVQVWFQNQRAKIKKLARRHAQESRNIANRKLFGSAGVTSDSMGIIKSSLIRPRDNQNLPCSNPQLPNCELGLTFLPPIMDRSNETMDPFKLDIKVNDELDKFKCLNEVSQSSQSNSQDRGSQDNVSTTAQFPSISPRNLSFLTNTDSGDVSQSYPLSIFNSLTSDDLKTVDSNMSSLFSGDNITMQQLFLTSTLMGSLSQEEVNALKVTVQGSQLDEQTSDGPINKLYSMQHSYFM